MAENSGISWTDHTFNPHIGCTKVSPACTNCYAERDMDHRYGKVAWGPNGTRVLTSLANWFSPRAWNQAIDEGKCSACKGKGRRKKGSGRSTHYEPCQSCNTTGKPIRRPRVFCASLADVFEDWQGPILSHRKDADGTPFRLYHFEGGFEEHRITANIALEPVTMNDVRRNLFRLIDATPHLDWLLLTKRPENIRRMWPARAKHFDGPGWNSSLVNPHYRHNVWLGTSVENQEFADKRIPELLNCRDLSPVLFLSCEPLVGLVDLTRLLLKQSDAPERGKPDVTFNAFRAWGYAEDPISLDWIITGGESGPNARPGHPDWYRSLRDQCAAAGVPFHFKQHGEWLPFDRLETITGVKDTTPVCLVKKDGRVFRPYSHAEHAPGQQMARVGKKAAGRLLDGQLHDAFPEVVKQP